MPAYKDYECCICYSTAVCSFNGKYKSLCNTCLLKGYSVLPPKHKCKECGEEDEDNFYKRRYTLCKKCYCARNNARVKQARIKAKTPRRKHIVINE